MILAFLYLPNCTREVCIKPGDSWRVLESSEAKSVPAFILGKHMQRLLHADGSTQEYLVPAVWDGQRQEGNRAGDTWAGLLFHDGVDHKFRE